MGVPTSVHIDQYIVKHADGNTFITGFLFHSNQELYCLGKKGGGTVDGSSFLTLISLLVYDILLQYARVRGFRELAAVHQRAATVPHLERKHQG